MFSAQSVWAREGEDGEVGRKKSEFEVRNSEKINQPYTLYLFFDPMLYALCPAP